MSDLYLDTSALVKLYVEEEQGREVVREAVGGAGRVATSTVAYAEAQAALARIPVSNLVAYRAGEMADRYALRGFDAIHLASAVRLGERFDGLRFLVFGDRLVEAARGASVLMYEGG